MKLTRRALISAAPLAAASVRLPRKIRVALLGLDGHTAEVTRPLPQLPDVELVAVSDPNPKSRGRYAKAQQYEDWRALLAKQEFEVAAVCNVHSEHAAAILACMERGIHVIAEKPIATEFADLERLRVAVERGKAELTAMLPMRLDSPYLALKEIAASGEIGEVVQIDGQKSYKSGDRPAWFYKRSTYGGTMPWIGIHMVDLMLHTSGRDFKEAFGWQNHLGFPETGDTENVSGTVFHMDNGGVALLRIDYLRPQTAATHGDDRLRLAGLKGIAEYMESTGVTLVSGRRGRTVVDKLPAPRSLFSEFLDHVYNGKPAPISWKEIYRSHQVVLGARQAMETGRVRAL